MTKLKDGEVICPECDGFRYKKYHQLTRREKDRKGLIHCPKCQGSGKLDWIENITGKKDIIIKVKHLTPKNRKLKKDWTIQDTTTDAIDAFLYSMESMKLWDLK